MKKTKMDKLVPYSLRAHKKYCKMHHEVEAATQLELPLQKNTAPPPFKRLRRRSAQQWLGE